MHHLTARPARHRHGDTGSDADASLDDASLRINGTTVSVLEPVWSKGDDLCCPSKLRERDYQFDAKTLTFRRTADTTTPFTTT